MDVVMNLSACELNELVHLWTNNFCLLLPCLRLAAISARVCPHIISTAVHFGSWICCFLFFVFFFFWSSTLVRELVEVTVGTSSPCQSSTWDCGLIEVTKFWCLVTSTSLTAISGLL